MKTAETLAQSLFEEYLTSPPKKGGNVEEFGEKGEKMKRKEVNQNSLFPIGRASLFASFLRNYVLVRK